MAYGSKSKMYPNVALALAALALLLLAGRAAGETAKERVERFKLVFDSISGSTEARIQQNQYVRR